MTSAAGPGYNALLDVRTELVDKLVTCRADPNVLIVKAKDRGMIGSIQASAAVAPGSESGREETEQLVNQILEATKTDDTKVEEFAQLLEENSLGEVAAFLRGKPTEHPSVQDSHAPFREPEQRIPGDGYGDRPPKLEPVSLDSGIAKDTSQVQNGNTSPEFDRTQKKQAERKAGVGMTLEAVPGGTMAQSGGNASPEVARTQQLVTTETSGVPFEPVPGGIVYAEQEHTDNIQVDSDNPTQSVEDTQPHSEESQAVMGGSSVPVLPETRSLLQTNQELQAQLAEKATNEQELQEQLDKMSMEKKGSEEKLKQTEKELQEKRIELEEKELQIERLKTKNESKMKEMTAEVKRLQQELHDEKQSNVTEKKMLEEKINDLECQLKENKEKFYKEKIDLIMEKHTLELEIQKMHTEEEKLKRYISDEQCKVARLNAQLIENKTEQTLSKLKHVHEQQLENMRHEHRNNLSKMEKEILELRRRTPTDCT